MNEDARDTSDERVSGLRSPKENKEGVSIGPWQQEMRCREGERKLSGWWWGV
jgi:hypothetical protein